MTRNLSLFFLHKQSTVKLTLLLLARQIMSPTSCGIAEGPCVAKAGNGLLQISQDFYPLLHPKAMGSGNSV